MSQVFDLVGAAEAADILGIGTPNFTHLRKKDPNFPDPVVVLRCGPIWEREAVCEYAAERTARRRQREEARTS